MDRDLLHILVVVGNFAVAGASIATGLRASDPFWLLRRPGLLVRSLLTVLLVVPLVAMVLAQLLLPDAPIARAGLAVTLVAVGIAPPEVLKHTDSPANATAYEIGLNLATMAVAVVYIPAAVALHGALFAHDVALPWRPVARIVLMQALLPFAVGVALVRFFPRQAASVEHALPRIVGGLQLAVLLVALVVAGPALVKIDLRVWLTCLAFAAVGIAIGHFAGGPAPQTRIVLATVSAMRFSPLAIAIVTQLPREALVLVPIVLVYALCSSAAVAAYRGAMARRQGRA